MAIPLKRSVKGRPNAHKRGYTRQWENAAFEFLQRNRWCLGCEAIGVRRPAELVDHIVPHRGDQHKFNAMHNWQPACAWHHNAIKPILERRYAAGEIPAAELVLCSATARKLTQHKYRPVIGADGFPIPGS